MQKGLGEFLNKQRIQKDLTLRELARRVEIGPSYLSDIENDRRVPAEDVLKRFAVELEIDVEDIMARAARLGETAERYLETHPYAVRLVRKIAACDLSEEQLKKLCNQVK